MPNWSWTFWPTIPLAAQAEWFHVSSLLIAMLVLLVGSAFFSASEAALFSLNWTAQDASRTRMVDRLISQLLSRSDRLLSSILLYNLAINVIYFALSTIVANLLVTTQAQAVWLVPIAALVLIIFFGELIPKSLGVAAPLNMSRSVAVPLSWAVAVAAPITPTLQWVCELSRRLVWPGMKPEQYLDVADLERAIDLSGSDASLIKHEKDMLQNTVQLSVVRIEEWMRPRSSFLCIDLHADIQLAINEQSERQPDRNTDYILVSSETSEVAASIRLADISYAKKINWQAHIRPVLIAPWCQTLGDVLTTMQKTDNQVALIVNEFGESIGVATFEDLIESIFSTESAQTPAFSMPAFDQTGNLQWEVTGSTSVRRIERALATKLPSGRHVTVSGLLQHELQRLPREGDCIEWGGYQFEVCKVARRGEVLCRMTAVETSLSSSALNNPIL